MQPFVYGPRQRQRGTTLLEALVAFLVFSLGMLSMARVQTHLRLNADVARQRSEAVRLAQEDLESLRAFAALAMSPGVRSFDGIANESRTVDGATGYTTNTSYLVRRQIDAADQPSAKNASIAVSWSDRSGNVQQVALNSIIAGIDPAFSGALGLARSGATVKGPRGRSIAIPPAAKDLGNGASVFKPVSSGSIAFVFDNATGLVTKRCTGMKASVLTRDLGTGDLASCDANVGRWLSGIVRFSSASPPDASIANDAPALVAVTLALSGGEYASAPDCSVEAMKTVSYRMNGQQHIDAVSINATAAAMGLPGWVETGERHVAYHCAVYPLPNGQWSGRASLVPTGWTIGTGTADRRVCRFTSDLDGSGSADANIEHPATYAGVDSTLANQNYLVINGTESCPGGHAIHAAGGNSDVFVDLGTVQHQP